MIAIGFELGKHVQRAIRASLGDASSDADPQLRISQDERFGDYQSNCAMGLARHLGVKPRELAARIVEALEVGDLCEPPEIAGPGFINFRLKPSAVAARLQSIPPAPADGPDRMGLPTTSLPRVVVIDMCSPNLAKEMHVGHLRSTLLGECFARILEFEGHTVHRVNHVGDWGTQFGMLVAYLRKTHPESLERLDQLQLPDLEAFYVAAKAEFDRDESFAAEARRTVTLLQGGDAATRAVWKAFCEESLRHVHDILERLEVRVEDRGESSYNEMLPQVVAELESKGLTTVSDGAVCIFLEGFVNREGAPLPMMIRKSDGGYNYSATDLAAMKHRLTALRATRLIYVVGAPQKQHLEMLFAAAGKAGWLGPTEKSKNRNIEKSKDDQAAADHSPLVTHHSPAEIVAEHIAFGQVLGSDGRPFKTREGGTVKLKTLLEEAVTRARGVIETAEGDRTQESQTRSGAAPAQSPVLSPQHFSEAERERIAETVGLAAVKYFDLSHNLASDYKFEFDHMLAMEGNTAPYMLYAYARIRSIGRKAGIDYAAIPPDTPIMLEHESEIRLGKALARLPEVIAAVSAELRPNLLTDYLYELSKAFSGYYDRVRGVRVIDASPEPVRLSRLRLCDLTARAIRLGLRLLGIRTLERM